MVLEPFSYYNVSDSSFPTRTSSWAPTPPEAFSSNPVDSVDINFLTNPQDDDFDEREMALGTAGSEGLMDQLYREFKANLGKTTGA